MFDLGIINGRIYVDGKWINGNLYIRNKKIAAISDSYLEAAEEYDANQRMVLPGFIDPHVHFSLTVGKFTSVDDFKSGSIAAAFGGITTFIDFLDPISKLDDIEKAFNNRLELAKESVVDYSFHATIAELKNDPWQFVNKMKDKGIPTIKLFTTYSGSERRTYDRTIDKLLALSKESKITILVHAENDDIVIEKSETEFDKHDGNRPAIAEISEIIKLAEMTKYRDGRMYIVHNSCGTTLKRLKEAYGDILNKDFYIESCPHYFALSKDLYKTDKGYLYTMTPPLRASEEVEMLIDNINNVYTIGTDHCPFYEKDKNKKFLDNIPMGVGSIEYSFPVMYSLFGEKVINKFTENPARVHGLYPQKGNLLPGADADIVIFDPEYEYIISKGNSKADYSIYEGKKVKGKICSTISKGSFVIKEGCITYSKGEFIKRQVI